MFFFDECPKGLLISKAGEKESPGKDDFFTYGGESQQFLMNCNL